MSSSAERVRRIVVVALSFVVLGSVPASTAPRTGPPVLGVTHTQVTADGDSAADARARDYLTSAPLAGNQHIMGWGALNPEPSPGVFDWSTLDHRMDLLRRTTDDPVITLCCAPDWMKGGEPGQTDWDKIEVPPAEEHFDDFAELAAAVAARYPYVKNFLVWNELKGFFDTERNTWDIEAYTRLYNKVYAAVKKANPAARIGGPYLVMISWGADDSPLSGAWGAVEHRIVDAIDYWMAHKVGADFIVVDGSNATRDNQLPGGDAAATAKFGDITRQLRKRTGLPVWWAEVYPEVDDDGVPSAAPRRAAIGLLAVARMVEAGAAKVLLWQPQADTSFESVALWSDTRAADGGAPLPMAGPYAWLARAAAAHRPITTAWTGDTVRVDDGETGVSIDANTGAVTYYGR
ncbi:GH39 family glycosyl hydrolase [Paractinoplanes durhamensis]|uniref:GH39 family glycosyl hydrolase n=1 Tax=Paractinoplanes durhamensis TaxID=113563 RepID=UPI00194532F5|nr:hypothetical protein [Actinoplanes durhamensis]